MSLFDLECRHRGPLICRMRKTGRSERPKEYFDSTISFFLEKKGNLAINSGSDFNSFVADWPVLDCDNQDVEEERSVDYEKSTFRLRSDSPCFFRGKHSVGWCI